MHIEIAQCVGQPCVRLMFTVARFECGANAAGRRRRFCRGRRCCRRRRRCRRCIGRRPQCITIQSHRLIDERPCLLFRNGGIETLQYIGECNTTLGVVAVCDANHGRRRWRCRCGRHNCQSVNGWRASSIHHIHTDISWLECMLFDGLRNACHRRRLGAGGGSDSYHRTSAQLFHSCTSWCCIGGGGAHAAHGWHCIHATAAIVDRCHGRFCHRVLDSTLFTLTLCVYRIYKRYVSSVYVSVVLLFLLILTWRSLGAQFMRHINANATNALWVVGRFHYTDFQLFDFYLFFFAWNVCVSKPHHRNASEKTLFSLNLKFWRTSSTMVANDFSLACTTTKNKKKKHWKCVTPWLVSSPHKPNYEL